MSILQKENRNAAKARHSFVTKRAESKLGTLSDVFKGTAGVQCTGVEQGTLERKLLLKDFRYLDHLRLIYNWENRFLSVNYNLQMLTDIVVNDHFEETGTCAFKLDHHKGKVSFLCRRWTGDNSVMRDACLERLSNPLILDRIRMLDILDMEITHNQGSSSFQISLDTMIGSATWIFIPPITHLVVPTTAECMRFFELFDLIGDAVVNNGKQLA